MTGAFSKRGRRTRALLALHTQRLFAASLVTSLSLHTFSHFPKVLLSGVSIRSQFFPATSWPSFFSKARADIGDCELIIVAADNRPAPMTARKVLKFVAFIMISVFSQIKSEAWWPSDNQFVARPLLANRPGYAA